MVGDNLTIRYRNLPHWEISGGIYFITFCAKQTASFLDFRKTERAIIKDCILYFHKTHWIVHILTVMPDHVHAILSFPENSHWELCHLSRFLKQVKGISARRINQLRGTTGSIWQAESYDHLIRNQREYEEILMYVVNNSVKRLLIEDPYQYDGLWFDGIESPQLHR